MISFTHYIFGLTLVYLAEKPLITGSSFALAPDFDITFNFLYPFVHRGITHTLLAASISTSLVYIYTGNRESAEACFIGYSSALGLDLLTSSGVPLLFPFLGSFSLDLASAYSLKWNLGIIAACGAAVTVKKNFWIFRPLFRLR